MLGLLLWPRSETTIVFIGPERWTKREDRVARMSLSQLGEEAACEYADLGLTLDAIFVATDEQSQEFAAGFKSALELRPPLVQESLLNPVDHDRVAFSVVIVANETAISREHVEAGLYTVLSMARAQAQWDLAFDHFELETGSRIGYLSVGHGDLGALAARSLEICRLRPDLEIRIETMQARHLLTYHLKPRPVARKVARQE